MHIWTQVGQSNSSMLDATDPSKMSVDDVSTLDELRAH
jgi:hypothetical protein